MKVAATGKAWPARSQDWREETGVTTGRRMRRAGAWSAVRRKEREGDAMSAVQAPGGRWRSRLGRRRSEGRPSVEV